MILQRPKDAWALYVLAHGAGAGMRHPFLEALAAALFAEGVATLRYDVPLQQSLEQLEFKGVPRVKFDAWCRKVGTSLQGRVRRWS